MGFFDKFKKKEDEDPFKDSALNSEDPFGSTTSSIGNNSDLSNSQNIIRSDQSLSGQSTTDPFSHSMFQNNTNNDFNNTNEMNNQPGQITKNNQYPGSAPIPGRQNNQQQYDSQNMMYQGQNSSYQQQTQDINQQNSAQAYPVKGDDYYYDTEPSRDVELILAKLDAIKAELDSMHQRIKKLEFISEKKNPEKKYW